MEKDGGGLLNGPPLPPSDIWKFGGGTEKLLYPPPCPPPYPKFFIFDKKKYLISIILTYYPYFCKFLSLSSPDTQKN